MNDYEEFELKYLEEIHQLYLNFKTTSNLYNINLFKNKNDNFMDIFDLVFESINFIDEEEIQEDNDTFINHENYSMLY